MVTAHHVPLARKEQAVELGLVEISRSSHVKHVIVVAVSVHSPGSTALAHLHPHGQREPRACFERFVLSRGVDRRTERSALETCFHFILSRIEEAVKVHCLKS